jgi:hypothetical protein
MKLRLLLIVWLFPLFSFSQRDTMRPPAIKGFYVGASVQYGFLWTHRYNMGHLVKKHISAFELDISKAESLDKAFHQPFHYPWTGVALHYIPLGNPDELGSAIGVYPYINFPLGKRSRAFKAHMRLGYGIGYITKPFDPLENHKNVAIGSHFNACMSLRLNAMWRLNEANYLELGLGLTHFSNGASTLPNLGLNLPMVNIGFHHRVFGYLCTKTTDEYNQKIAHTKEILAERNWQFNVLVVTGFNDVDPPGGKRYGLLNVLSSAMRQTSRKHKWGGGIDIMYSDAIRHRLAMDTIYVSTVGNMQPGVKIAYELVVGRISFPIEFGAYIYTRYKNFMPVYNRFGVHYLVNDHLILNVSLKSHLARAEYFEYGAGWRF